MLLNKDNIMEATMRRMHGAKYEQIAKEVFNVSGRTERRWRQRGKSDFASKVNRAESLYARYYVTMGLSEL